MRVAGKFDSAMPPLSFEERRELRQNIERDRRITMPIVVQASSGLVVDGWNRWEIAQELGLQEGDGYSLQWEDWDDDKAADKAISLNLHRRNLDRAQKQALALELRRRGWSLSRIGRAVGVDHKTVSHWLEHAGASDLGKSPNFTPSSPIPAPTTVPSPAPVPAQPSVRTPAAPPVPPKEVKKTQTVTTPDPEREARRAQARLDVVIDRAGRLRPAERRVFTPEQREDAVARLRGGEPIERIAEDVGCSTGAIYSWARGGPKSEEWSVAIPVKPLSVLLERISRYWTPPPIDRWDWGPESVAQCGTTELAATIDRLQTTVDVCSGMLGRLREVQNASRRGE